MIRRALGWLDRLPDCRVAAVSRLRLTTPLGPAQPRFVNAVARLATPLGPRALLARLQRLERAAGRRRGMRWGPRSLDLDLLLYADTVMATPDLTVPHPELVRRRFVLEPLCELDPELRHPVLDRSLLELLEALPFQAAPTVRE